MITRKQYLGGEATHAEYYSEIAALLNIRFRPSILDQVRDSLQTNDPHLNRIPLYYWDTHAISLPQQRVREILAARGDSYSLSSGVCILKAAAAVAVA